MDSVSKRQLVLAIFMVLQSWKLYEWLKNLPEELLSVNDILDALIVFLLRWSVVDLAFIIALHLARVPKMIWSTSTKAMVFAVLFGFNAALTILAPIFLADIPQPIDKPVAAAITYTALVDDIAGSKESLATGNIAGEFTLKVRPWAVAKLNHLEAPCCLPTSTAPPNSQSLSDAVKRPLISDEGPSVRIPLSLSGTGPWTVTWEWTSFYASKFVAEQQFTGVHYQTDSHILAEKLGYYRVTGVVDGNGMTGKVPSSIQPVKVEPCPEARIDGLILRNGIDVCVRQKSQHPLKVWISGEAPFELKLTRFSGSSSKLLVFSDLKANEEAIEGITRIGKFALVPLDIIDFDSAGEHLIRIETVKDSSGRIKAYGLWDSGDSVLVNAHQPPSMTWKSTVPQVLLKGVDHVELGVGLEGRKPYEVEYDLIDPLSNEVIESFKKTTESKLLLLKAKKAGVYRLKTISDSICKGPIVGSIDCHVLYKEPPTAMVTFKPIHSPCNGELGGLFEMEMGGTGPWKVSVQEDDELESWIESKEAKVTYKWLPESPGQHTIKFAKIADSYYTDGVPLDDPSYKVNVSPLPDAVIKSATKHSCIGSPLPAIVTIKLSGIGPWKLEGSLTNTDGSVHDLNLDCKEPIFEFEFPEFLKAGKSILRLSKIIDANGCSKIVDNQMAQINVLPVLPTVSFTQETVKIREDRPGELPLVLKGNKGPWKVDIQFTSVDGKKTIESFELESNKMKVEKAGTYELLSVSDQYCVGVIGETARATVTAIPIPKVSFDGVSKKASCRSAPSKVHPVQLSVQGGTGTITVKYTEQSCHDLKDCSGKRAIESQMTLESGIKLIQIPVKTGRLPGFVRYKLVSVSDDIYDRVNLKGVEFIQQIYPDPRPRFSATSAPVHCLHESLSEAAKIPIDFAGSGIVESGPWTLKYELVDPEGNITSRAGAVEQANGELLVTGLQKAGQYHIWVKQVSSQTGCVWTDDAESMESAMANSSATSLIVMQTPTISKVPSPASHYCVGEVASFELTGQGPWTVQYRLRKLDGTEIRKSDTLRSPLFTVLLAEAGSIHIDSVSNSRCRLDNPLGSMLEIKRLPSAVIDAGSQWVHEDETASFMVRLGGEPPFSFTYQRLDDTSKDVVLETRTVSGIDAHEYKVEVPSVSGTFRIESVQDKFCRYPSAPRPKQ